MFSAESWASAKPAAGMPVVEPAHVEMFAPQEVLHRSTSFDLHQAYRRWAAAAATELPLYRDLLGLLNGLRNRVVLLEQEGDDFFYLHVGAMIVEQAGFDMTGFRLSELPGPLAAFYRDVTRSAVDMAEPRFVRLSAQRGERMLFWELLILPFRRHAASPMQMVAIFVSQADSVERILLQVFQETQVGLMVLRPIRDNDGAIVDGWVVLANVRASRFFGFDPTTTSSRRLRTLDSVLGEDRIWNRLFNGTDTSQAVIVTLHQMRHLISVSKAGNYLVLRLSDPASDDASVVFVD
jgi:hypothetical protein